MEEIKEKAQKELQIKVNLRRAKQLKMSHSPDPESNLIRDSIEKSSSIPWDISEDSFCFKCGRIKPPRAHHCKECKKFFILL